MILCAVLFSCKGQNRSEIASVNASQKAQREGLGRITIPDNGFSCGLVDSEGNIWFGSNGGGVFRYDGNTFENYTEEYGLSSNQVFSIIEDNNKHLWFGTQNGLNKFDGNTFEHIPLPHQDIGGVWLSKVYPVINPNAAHALAKGKNDDVWIGTAGGGAYHYDGENFKSYLVEIGKKQEDSLYHNWIPDITEDKEGNIWFASMTHGGVSRFDGEKFTQYLVEDGLSDNMVRTIFCDKSGNIWIGYNGNRNSGLTFYNGKSFKNYFKEDGLCNKRIRAIYEDKNGEIWLGAGQGNLCIYDGQNFTEFKHTGRTFSEILFIFDDVVGNIWFGGSTGIWKFDGQTVTNMTVNIK